MTLWTTWTTACVRIGGTQCPPAGLSWRNPAAGAGAFRLATYHVVDYCSRNRTEDLPQERLHSQGVIRSNSEIRTLTDLVTDLVAVVAFLYCKN